MTPILLERGYNFFERDIDERLWTSAGLLVGSVTHDPVEPGSEGRVSPERVDLPHHAPERILNGFLGIVPVARDPDGQTIRTLAIRGREPFGGLRVTPAQRLKKLLVSINSRRDGLRIRCAASSGARMMEP